MLECVKHNTHSLSLSHGAFIILYKVINENVKCVHLNTLFNIFLI